MRVEEEMGRETLTRRRILIETSVHLIKNHCRGGIGARGWILKFAWGGGGKRYCGGGVYPHFFTRTYDVRNVLGVQISSFFLFSFFQDFSKTCLR